MTKTYFEKTMRDQIAVGRYDHTKDPDDGMIHFTIGELCSAVFVIETDADARRFFVGYAEWLSRQPDLSDDPFDVAKSNIGWFFGEGMSKYRIEMWVRACGAIHPVFGIAMPDLKEAFDAGMKCSQG